MRRLRSNIYFLFLVMVIGFFISQNSLFAAETYPQKPIEVIVPFPPGGPTDIGIRIYADKLTKILKKNVVVVNRAGGGGAVGTNEVVRTKKDGYTLLGGTSTPIVVLPITNPKEVSYDSLRDLEPISHCISIISDMVVRKESSFNTFEDLEKYVKANPGKLNMGVHGITHPYYIFHILKEQGLDMNLVMAKGTPQNVSFLLGGHVDAIIDHVGVTGPYLREGSMKPMVVFAHKRLPDFPNMPSIVEKGYPRGALVFFIGFFAPKGTPQPIVDVLASALEEASRDPDVAANLNKLAFPIDFKRGPEFKTLIVDQEKIIREIATKTKIIQ